MTRPLCPEGEPESLEEILLHAAPAPVAELDCLRIECRVCGRVFVHTAPPLDVPAGEMTVGDLHVMLRKFPSRMRVKFSAEPCYASPADVVLDTSGDEPIALIVTSTDLAEREFWRRRHVKIQAPAS